MIRTLLLLRTEQGETCLVMKIVSEIGLTSRISTDPSRGSFSIFGAIFSLEELIIKGGSESDFFEVIGIISQRSIIVSSRSLW